MKKKFTLKINRKKYDVVTVDVSKFKDEDLGKKEIIKTILHLPQLRKVLLGKEITQVNFSLVPQPEITIQAKKPKNIKRGMAKIKKEIKPILEALRSKNTKKAEEETARLILKLLEKLDNKEVDHAEISDYFETLFWSKGFIENMPEPLNSAVLEGADLNYYNEKGRKSRYHLEEFKNIIKYLRSSSEKILRR
ncbi:MAG: hypothetical protein CH104c_0067 [Candidatus Woesebacteria bacterium]|jgi:Zn-dependent oligopeptidase|nr:MAG: hypothetical protein CH104c_0067 [Candidatus Woesebacteria bacterium]